MDVKELTSGLVQLVGMNMAIRHMYLCNYLPIAYFLFCAVSMVHHFFRAFDKESIELLHLDMFMQYANCVIFVGLTTPLGICFTVLAYIVLRLDLTSQHQRYIAYIINGTMIGISAYPHPAILYTWIKVGIFFLIGVFYDNGLIGAVYHLIGHKAALEMWKICQMT